MRVNSQQRCMILLFVTCSAHANMEEFLSDSQGWNLGAGAAVSYHQFGDEIDDNLINAHISAGYRVNRYIGVEGRLGRGLSSIDLPAYDMEVEQDWNYSGYLKTMAPLDSGFTPYLLVGAQHNEIIIESLSDSDTSISYGLGLSYRLSGKTVGVDVGVEALKAFQHSELDYDIWDFGVKVGYQF